jgi:hypothetical protein
MTKRGCWLDLFTGTTWKEFMRLVALSLASRRVDGKQCSRFGWETTFSAI